MGSADKKQTYELLEYFYEQGGNFIDTANDYVRTSKITCRISCPVRDLLHAIPHSYLSLCSNGLHV